MRLVATLSLSILTPEDLPTLYVAPRVDMIELRLDDPRIAGPADVGAWVAASPRPVLATVRSRAEGGAFSGSPRDAAALLLAAAGAGAPWIDAEASVVPLVLPEAR